jgi:Flp pilus assembly pilin Flp
VNGMRTLAAKLRRFRYRGLAVGVREQGQTLIEYALIIGSIAVVVAVILPLIWPALEPGFQTVISTFGG